METKLAFVDENFGMRLRSGKVKIVPQRKSYEYINTTYFDDSYHYPCDDYFNSQTDSVEQSIEEKMNDYFNSQTDYVEQSIEEKITSKIDVPSGYGKEAGRCLEKLNRCHQDCLINHDQLHGLVKKFTKHLSWFPEDVSEEKVKKYCREAYTHSLWKAFLDEEISRRQFVNLMGGKPKYFTGKRCNR